MSGSYGNDFITITDDDGNTYELEHLDTVNVSGELYMAFVPADMDEDDDDYGLVVLKVVTQGTEESFVSIDDDDELNTIYELFVERLSDDDEDDDDYFDFDEEEE
ncbi:MAG: DUF1292 domain-containing protein [Oscillospiraceae bacterium]|nr:DUF1292 domain-containing protein [Oscillospiraceae bacterium]